MIIAVVVVLVAVVVSIISVFVSQAKENIELNSW